MFLMMSLNSAAGSQRPVLYICRYLFDTIPPKTYHTDHVCKDSPACLTKFDHFYDLCKNSRRETSIQCV